MCPCRLTTLTRVRASSACSAALTAAGVPRLAVFRPTTGQWLIKGRGNADDWAKSVGNVTVQCGQDGDVPLPFDYFGEGRPRLAVFRPATGEWHIKGALHMRRRR